MAVRIRCGGSGHRRTAAYGTRSAIRPGDRFILKAPRPRRLRQWIRRLRTQPLSAAQVEAPYPASAKARQSLQVFEQAPPALSSRQGLRPVAVVVFGSLVGGLGLGSGSLSLALNMSVRRSQRKLGPMTTGPVPHLPHATAIGASFRWQGGLDAIKRAPSAAWLGVLPSARPYRLAAGLRPGQFPRSQDGQSRGRRRAGPGAAVCEPALLPEERPRQRHRL